MNVEIDWTECPDTEIVPGKVSGKPLLKDTRVPADMLARYYQSLVDHGTRPNEALADTNENYPGAGAERLKRILDYFHAHQPQPYV